MTTGKPESHLWRYALPLLLGNWLQLAYNAVDSMIAGRFIGQEALAAEGAAAPVMNLVILAISGMSIGAGVLMSECFGAKNFSRLRRVMGTMLLVGGWISVGAAVLGFLLAPAILRALSVPTEIQDITAVYLRITLLGIPFTFCYNGISAGMKSVGDSRTPLRILAIASILNAVLDLFLLGVLHLGIVCSAVTTVVAQMVSAAAAWLAMRKQAEGLCPAGGDYRADGGILRSLLAYGVPSALQQAIQPIGKVLIQGQVNALGVSTIAAYNAVTRVDDFACIPEQSIGAAISTYTAQNRGAGKKERLPLGLRAGLTLEAGYFVLICGLVLLLRTPIVSLFVTGEGAAEVIRIGSEYLGVMAFFYLWPAMTNGVQGFVRGMGKLYVTAIATLTQTLIRVIGTAILAPRMGITGIAFACAAGWSVMLLGEVPYALTLLRKNDKA